MISAKTYHIGASRITLANTREKAAKQTKTFLLLLFPHSPLFYFFSCSIYSCYIGPPWEFELATYCSRNPPDKSTVCHHVIILSRLCQPGLNVSLGIATIWNFHKYLRHSAAVITSLTLTPKGPLVHVQFLCVDISLCNYIHLKAQKVLIWWSASTDQSFRDTLIDVTIDSVPDSAEYQSVTVPFHEAVGRQQILQSNEG